METLPLLYAYCLKQKPLQTSEKRLTAVVLAPPARLELTTFRLGGGPSIPVRYGGLYNKYSIFRLNRNRTNCRLEGGCSIQLSYGDIYSNLFAATRYFRLFPHIQAEPPKFLRTLALAENLENPVAIRTRL